MYHTREVKSAYKILARKSERASGIDVRIILKWILKQNMTVWTGKG
jgi:hypothetical protein